MRTAVVVYLTVLTVLGFLAGVVYFLSALLVAAGFALLIGLPAVWVHLTERRARQVRVFTVPEREASVTVLRKEGWGAL